MSEFIKTGYGTSRGSLGATAPAITGSIMGGGILGGVAPKPAATKSSTDWSGTLKSGFDAIASVFGKGSGAGQPMVVQESPSYWPWILGGVAVIGGIYLLKRRGKKK